MSFSVVGLSHRTAPLDLLEKMAVARDFLPDALERMGRQVNQGVLLSTCNRLELYAPGDSDELRLDLKEFLSQNSAVNLNVLEPYLYSYGGGDCVRHLFRVATGLDSMVTGDVQVLGQVQTAYCAANEMGLVRGSFSKLFHQALQVGCRIHRETNFGNNFRSVSHAGAQLASRFTPDAAQSRVLLLGTGEVGRLAAKSLVERGFSQITIMNRTHWRAEALAEKIGGTAVPFNELPEQMARADLVVSSTGSPDYVVEAPMVRDAMAQRDGKPLLLIDIAMPRDIDPAVGVVPGVRLYDMESLRLVTEVGDSGFLQEKSEVETVVDDETDRFLTWLESLDAVPLISAIRQQAEEMRQAEIAKTLSKLKSRVSTDQGSWDLEDLSAHLDSMTYALVKKMLHRPTVYLKAGKDPVRQQMVREIFELE